MQKSVINNIFEIISKGVKSGIGQIYTEDKFYDRTTITFGNQQHVNFGSYSYLGLEHDQRLKSGAADAIRRYGIQYPSSRTYVSSTPYKELEALLKQMFKAPVVLATSTTLAHVATMPIVVNEDDVIIMDQQVHSSVQFMVSHLQLQGVPFHLVRHNNLENLEKQIIKLSEKYSKVWYMLDGIYSMYGDVAPMKELEKLLNKYPKFHLYVDDAHGMSWCGKNGVGYALNEIALHDRMILVTSLNKAFAAGGALVVMKDEELSNLVSTCGGPFIFAGQHQMSALGAGIACANIHLTPEIEELQDQLAFKVSYCQSELESYGLPIISSPNSPIFFVGVGLPRVGYNVVKKMISSGQYVNLAIFPAVAETRTGVRFTITRNHTLAQISEMASLLSIHFKQALIEEERTLKDIHHAFRRVIDLKPLDSDLSAVKKPSLEQGYKLQHETSISKIPEELWNSLLGDQSSLDWEALKSLEKVFSRAKKSHQKWKFHYYIVRNQADEPLLATYFTLCLTKDDAISSANVSRQIEKLREEDPTYLCSKTYMMGCPISIGNHIYLNRENNHWKSVLMFFLDAVWKDQELLRANTLNLRDFSDSDEELKQFFTDQGFIKLEMLDNHMIKGMKPFAQPDDYLNQLRSSQKHFVKKRALKYAKYFRTTFLEGPQERTTVNQLYKLYKNVKDKSFELNMFDYPKGLFSNALKDPNWEVMTLSIEDHKEGVYTGPVAMAISVKTEKNYNFLIAGLDYEYLADYEVYSQLLWQLVLRANDLGYKNVDFGLTTGQNKRKFGAKSYKQTAFIQLKDNFNATIIASMSNQKTVLPEKLTVKKKKVAKTNS